MTTSCLLEIGANRDGSADALVWIDNGEVQAQSYDELDGQVTALAAEIARRLPPGAKRVGLLVDDPVLCLRMSWALFRIGAAVVLLNTRLPVNALRDQCFAASCSVVVTDRASVFADNGPAELQAEDICATASEGRERDVRSGFASARTVLFTSGSSGVPRGVSHGIRAHVYSAVGSNTNIPLEPGDRWLLALPQYHVSGLSIAFRCFAAGAAVAIAPSQDLFDSARKLGATHLSLVSTQLDRLIRRAEAEGHTLAGLTLLVGGGPIPVAMSQKAVSLGARVYVSYGMSEMASQITTTDGTGSADELSTSGRPLPFRSVRIAATGSGRQADASSGAIEVGGRTLFDGYVGVSESGPRDGWFATGDIGLLDESGRLTIRGRLDRMFISGGENIHPEEIERLLLQQPGVNRAAVVPVSDPEFGRRPVAFVDPVLDEAAAERLRDTLSLRLPRYALPVAFYPFQSDAETSISKLDYRKLTSWAERHRKHAAGR